MRRTDPLFVLNRASVIRKYSLCFVRNYWRSNELFFRLKGLKAPTLSWNILVVGHRRVPSADIHFWQGVCERS